MGRGLSVIRRCSNFLNKKVMGNVIKTIVLSHLDYCSGVWSGAAISTIKKLQIAQNKAACCLLRCPLRSSVDAMHGCLSMALYMCHIPERVIVCFERRELYFASTLHYILNRN